MSEPKIPDLPPKKVITAIKLKNGLVRRRVQTFTQGPTRTLQEPAIDADIHNIMKKYVHTHGSIPMAQIVDTVLDFSDATDFQESLDRHIHAQEAFNSLPADTRHYFHNDPSRLISFLADDKNYDEAVKMGFIDPSTAAKRNPPSSGSTPSISTTP